MTPVKCDDSGFGLLGVGATCIRPYHMCKMVASRPCPEESLRVRSLRVKAPALFDQPGARSTPLGGVNVANHSSPPLGYRTEVSGFARSELVTMPAWDSIAVLGDKIEPQPDGCWLWTGRTDDAGYGQYQGHFAGIESHHECHNRACCNPEHISPMTPSDHMSHHARERWAS